LAGESLYVKQFLIAGTLALTLTAAGQAHSQQPIPDAPHPQATLPPVTPGIAPNSSTSAPADPDQPAVGSTLPSSPKSAAPEDQPSATDHDFVGDAAPDSHASDLPTLRLNTNFVEVPFTVKDSHGNLVPGIDWREVRVFENGIRQKMAVFTVDPVPLSIAIVIDQSMSHDSMTRVNNALGFLPSVFAPYDSVAVFTYNNGPKMQTDYTAGTSPRLAAVIEQSKSAGRDQMYYDAGEALSQGINLNSGAESHINPLTSGGPGSPQGLSHDQVPRDVHTLNDAILMAAESLTHAAKGRRRIIYVISDGKEYGSTAKTKQVIKYLQENQISVYATLTGDSAIYGMGFIEKIHLPLEMRDNILPQYTNATGGQTVSEYRTPDIERSFAKITEQVRTQYTVGYYSREPITDGKFRTLEVRVLRPNLDVIAKKGYYPTPQAFASPNPEPVSSAPRNPTTPQ
jgi:VWFA-related protein